METKKIGHYKNGIEITNIDFKNAKEMLVNMPKYKGKLSNYGALSKLKHCLSILKLIDLFLTILSLSKLLMKA